MPKSSVASTTLGLTLGRWLGRYAEHNAAFIGGVILTLTGVAFAANAASGCYGSGGNGSSAASLTCMSRAR